MISQAGKQRVEEPETPEEVFGDESFLARQGYKALPSRFQEVIAFFHDEKDAGKYHAPEIYG